MAFKLCCDNPKVEEYSLIHEYISKSTKSELMDLIMYLPEMESYQSSHDTIYSIDTYDDYLYKLFMNKMSLTDEDIKYIESSKPPIIDRLDGEYFKDKICKSCQKLIFHKRTTKNKVIEIFRHIRNSLSHGCFNIVDDMFIGFDHPTFNGAEYNAVIKVKYFNLLNTLKEMTDIDSLEKIYKGALKNLDYEILDEKEGSPFADLFVRKNGVLYCLQFKKFDGRYINQLDIQQVIRDLRHIDKTNFIFVLIVDSTYTNSKINSYVLNEHISILDKKFIKEMLEGRDVLKELADAQI